jgi:hypothetical protein
VIEGIGAHVDIGLLEVFICKLLWSSETVMVLLYLEGGVLFFLKFFLSQGGIDLDNFILVVEWDFV